MRFTIVLMALLPLVLGAKELLSDEISTKDLSEDNGKPITDGKDTDETMMVKRSIDIAARRRSALDKNFMRFGRSDPGMSNGNLMRFGRARQDFMRFGRARNQNVMRFGRSPANFMRFGRSGNNLMRFGRANNNLMRFGRAPNNLMRFGRGPNLMRFGRANNNLMRFGRAPNNLMRFGRSDDEFSNYDSNGYDNEEDNDDENPEESDCFLRTEKSTENSADKLLKYFNQKAYDKGGNVNSIADKGSKNNPYFDDGFMRLGRVTTDNPIENMKEEEVLELLFPEETRKKRSANFEERKENNEDITGNDVEEPHRRRYSKNSFNAHS